MSWRRPTVIGLALLAALAGSASIASYAEAAFTSAPTASQSISSRNLIAPASLAATPSGHDVSLSWPAGTSGSGYQLLTAANGTSSNCASASFTSLTTTTGLAATDTGRSTPQGTYQCYQVRTTYNTWWSINSNPTAAAQLGFVASSVAITNGGAAGDLDTGDTIVITYNQPVDTTTGPAASDNLCTDTTTNTIVVGSTGAGATCAVTPGTVGTITGMTIAKKGRLAATWTWNTAHTVLTVTLGAKTAGSTGIASGTGTFNPTTTAMLSANGAFHNCDTNTAGGNCLPTITGGF